MSHTQNDSRTVNKKKRGGGEGDTHIIVDYYDDKKMRLDNCQVKGGDEQDKRETCVIQATASSTHYLDDDDVIGSLLDVIRFQTSGSHRICLPETRAQLFKKILLFYLAFFIIFFSIV